MEIAMDELETELDLVGGCVCTVLYHRIRYHEYGKLQRPTFSNPSIPATNKPSVGLASDQLYIMNCHH